MSETDRQPRPWIRRSFVFTLLGGLTLCGVLFWIYVINSMGGGQTATSPDERFMIVVMRKSSPSDQVPYQITLREYASGNILRRFDLYPGNGVPKVELRGGPRVIAWDDSNAFAEITIGGKRLLRIYAPE